MSAFYIGDLHAHPSLKPFRKYNSSGERLNIWEPVPGPAKRRKSITTTPDSRSNFLACIQGRNRLIFAALHPVERTFFDVSLIHSQKLKTRLTASIANFDEIWLERELEKIRDNKGIDYYDELIREKNYFIRQAGTYYQCKDGSCNYQLVHDYHSAMQTLNSGEHHLAVAFSIEGMHALLTTGAYRTLRRPDDVEDYRTMFEERIHSLKKDWKDKEGHSLTPFYITLCHHFWNKVCGHGESIEFGMIQQDIGKNSGFSSIGRTVIDALLSFDGQKGYRRILIDTKHMSPRSRMQFYAYRRERYPELPIISSHAAVNGIAELIDFYGKKEDFRKDPLHYPESYLNRGLAWMDKVPDTGEFFNASSLNLCDEDIREICLSKGLIGLILNEDRLPGTVLKRALKKGNRKKKKGIYIESIVANLMRIREKGGVKAWQMICLGTDFDGIINDLECYPSAAELPALARDLLNFLRSPQDITYRSGSSWFKKTETAVYTADEMRLLMQPYTPDQLVNMIFQTNLEQFMKAYYHDDYLQNPVEHRVDRFTPLI